MPPPLQPRCLRCPLRPRRPLRCCPPPVPLCLSSTLRAGGLPAPHHLGTVSGAAGVPLHVYPPPRLPTSPGMVCSRHGSCLAPILLTAQRCGDGDTAGSRELMPSMSPSLSSQGVWLQGHHPIQQLLPTQRPPAQHRPPLARLRQPWHPAAALLHRGHAAEAAPPGCQGEGLWGCVPPNGPEGVVEWVLFSGMGPPQVATDSLLLQRAAVPAQSPTRDLVELESWPKDSDGVAEDTKVSWGSSTPVLRGCQCVLSPLCPFHPPAHAVLQRWEAEHGELHRPRHG